MLSQNGKLLPTLVSIDLLLLVNEILAKTYVIDDGRATNPTSTIESQTALFNNAENTASDDSQAEFADPEDSDLVREAKKITVDPFEYDFDHKNVILYNLGIGATEKEVGTELIKMLCHF